MQEIWRNIHFVTNGVSAILCRLEICENRRNLREKDRKKNPSHYKSSMVILFNGLWHKNVDKNAHFAE